MHRILINRIPFVARESKKQGYLSVIFRLNHFQLFDVDTKYDVNKWYLEQSYKSLQKVIHPDNFSNGTREEREYSAFLSTYINSAYSVLKDDYDRSVYLLELNGLNLKEGETVKEGIEEIVDLNEEVETTTELQSLRERVRERIEEIKKEFSTHLNKGEIMLAKDKAIMLSYYMNIDEKIYYKINE